MNQYKCLVIGAGKIGALLDSPQDHNILTHANGYYKHPSTILSGFVEIHEQTGQEASRRWNIPHYKKLEQALMDIAPDIISLTLPHDVRSETLEKVVKYRPRILFLEKPLANDNTALEEIKKLIIPNEISCIVNYIRRFDTSMHKLQQNIENNEYGKLQKGVLFYTKGFKNNGSHLISLLYFLFGTPNFFHVLDSVSDYNLNDLTLEVRLDYNDNSSIHLIPLSENNYSTIEMILFFEKAKIHVKQFGTQIAILTTRKDPIFPGYVDLNEEAKFEQTGLTKGYLVAIDSMISHIENGSKLLSTFYEAYLTEKIVHHIYNNKNNLSRMSV